MAGMTADEARGIVHDVDEDAARRAGGGHRVIDLAAIGGRDRKYRAIEVARLKLACQVFDPAGIAIQRELGCSRGATTRTRACALSSSSTLRVATAPPPTTSAS